MDLRGIIPPGGAPGGAPGMPNGGGGGSIPGRPNERILGEGSWKG